MDDLVREWNFRINGGIHIAPNFAFKTMLFADDQIVVSRTESELQRAVYELQKVCEKYNFRISINKTKTMAFQGKFSVRTKIVLNDTPLEQVTRFKYLGTQLTYKHESDCKYKLPIFQQLCGTINRNLKNKARKETQIKFYKVIAVPSLLFGSETWTMTAADSKKLQAAEMKFLRKKNNEKFLNSSSETERVLTCDLVSFYPDDDDDSCGDNDDVDHLKVWERSAQRWIETVIDQRGLILDWMKKMKDIINE
ncbi:hypothetical protein ANN_13325 [Periplaneta americana]|uniref:Reverse transcriptase domain-containing protein n=1 Tax=Periplaneta americana TaxID=6978 RepID=A0ABQ8TLB6_PERAM|nr:hypothetical protein ANN_13325 [Periplaneta americana]